MFGLDPKSIQQAMAKMDKVAEDQKRLTEAVELLATLIPKLTTEFERLNRNLELRNDIR